MGSTHILGHVLRACGKTLETVVGKGTTDDFGEKPKGWSDSTGIAMFGRIVEKPNIAVLLLDTLPKRSRRRFALSEGGARDCVKKLFALLWGIAYQETPWKRDSFRSLFTIRATTAQARCASMANEKDPTRPC